MSYRTFVRTWWQNTACTIPGAGRKRYTGERFETAEEAREACWSHNLMRYGATMRGPKGKCMEFESV